MHSKRQNFSSFSSEGAFSTARDGSDHKSQYAFDGEGISGQVDLVDDGVDLVWVLEP